MDEEDNESFLPISFCIVLVRILHAFHRMEIWRRIFSSLIPTQTFPMWKKEVWFLLPMFTRQLSSVLFDRVRMLWVSMLLFEFCWWKWEWDHYETQCQGSWPQILSCLERNVVLQYELWAEFSIDTTNKPLAFSEMQEVLFVQKICLFLNVK